MQKKVLMPIEKITEDDKKNPDHHNNPVL